MKIMLTTRSFASLTVALLFASALIPVFAHADTACLSLTADLKSGSTGANVVKLQAFLASQGFFKVSSVARFGPATRAAVIAFQRSRGISQTGTVGPLTRAAIKS
ncbi:MAG: peptidoglycan-binding protein, partial [Candidatus Kaiserbacteria bacterium]|nr:peptidoglycan-binding protein [Candidatus Kaiserbacteria bacterium]